MSEIFECLVLKPVHKGYCISRVNGKVILISGAVPGEKVRVQITEEKKNYCIAQVVDVILPSPSRVSGVWDEGAEKGLGGLELAHVCYKDQLKWKTDVLHDTLDRIGGAQVVSQLKQLPPINVRDINTSSGYPIRNSNPKFDHVNWRTRMIFVADDNCLLGMSKYHTNDIVAVNSMPLSCKKILDSGILGENGILKNFLSPGDLVYCAMDSDEKVYFTIANVTYNDKAEVVSLSECEPILTQRVKDFAGFSYEYKITPKSFWQIHEKAPQVLVNCVLKACSGQDFSAYSDFNPLALGTGVDEKVQKLSNLSAKKVLELYSGSGLFTKPLAKYVGDDGLVVSVEGNKQAVENAKNNLGEEKNVKCYKQNITDKTISSLVDKHGGFDVVVADPSRSGCGIKVVEQICNRVCPDLFVYIACDIASLSRDLKVAVDNGYKIEQLVSYDLFPHTHHVETIVLLSRK